MALDKDSYAHRLHQHFSVLMANEDSSLAVDQDRLMLACIFVQNHCHMVIEEVDPSIRARVEEGKKR